MAFHWQEIRKKSNYEHSNAPCSDDPERQALHCIHNSSRNLLQRPVLSRTPRHTTALALLKSRQVSRRWQLQSRSCARSWNTLHAPHTTRHDVLPAVRAHERYKLLAHPVNQVRGGLLHNFPLQEHCCNCILHGSARSECTSAREPYASPRPANAPHWV